MPKYEKVDRAEQMKAITARLEQGVKDVFTSGKYAEYLAAMSKFHSYSYRNTMLIFLQNPSASHIAGFQTWKKEFERNVKRGEHGIKILAPSSYKVDVEVKDNGKPVLDENGKPVTEKKDVPGFFPVTVFDVSQTEGKPLPSIAERLSASVANFPVMLDTLREISPVPVSFENIAGETNGYFSRAEQKIAVQEGLSEAQTLKTLVHEITHATLHSDDEGKTKNRNTKEVEAESTAFAVCSYFGLDTSEYSFGYVAAWSKGKELSELTQSLELIQKTSADIIGSIEKRIAEREVAQTARGVQEMEAVQELQALQNVIDEPQFAVALTRLYDDTIIAEVFNEAETETDLSGGYSVPYGRYDTEEAARQAVSELSQDVYVQADELIPNRPKPIDKADLQTLRSIQPSRKSVLNFSDNEAEITRKFSDNMYAETGVKSPYERRVEDWRQAETTRAAVLKVFDNGIDETQLAKVKSDMKDSSVIAQGEMRNDDTGMTIRISKKGLDDTYYYASRYKDYVTMNAMYEMPELVKHGVLLDTNLAERNKGNKSPSTAFMHKLYSPFVFNGKPYVAKLTIEAYLASGDLKKQLYNLQNIKIITPPEHFDFSIKNGYVNQSPNDVTDISIAQLFEIVKTLDKNFYTHSRENINIEKEIADVATGAEPAPRADGMSEFAFSVVVKRAKTGNLIADVVPGEAFRDENTRVKAGLTLSQAQALQTKLLLDFAQHGKAFEMYNHGEFALARVAPSPQVVQVALPPLKRQTMPNGDVSLGNTSYHDIGTKAFIKTSVSVAEKIAEKLHADGVKFSSVLRSSGQATLTVNASDIEKAERYAKVYDPAFTPKYAKEKLSFEDVLSKFSNVKALSGTQHAASCPCCNDTKQHLYVKYDKDNGTILLDCKRGCSPAEIMSAVGLQMSDLFTKKTEFTPRTVTSQRVTTQKTHDKPAPKAEPRTVQSKPKEVAAASAQAKIKEWRNYNYTDKDGRDILQKSIGVLETGDKFAIWKHKENGIWLNGLTGIKPPLYQLPNALNNNKIYIVEGEKDVRTMARLGLPAVCSPHGSNWNADYAEHFAGKRVVVLTDNDDPGRKYGRDIADTVGTVALSLTVIPIERMISDIQKGGDISDMAELLGDTQARTLLERKEQMIEQSGIVYEAADYAENFIDVPSRGTEVAAAPAKYGDDFCEIKTALSDDKTVYDMAHGYIPFNAERLTDEINSGIDDIMYEIRHCGETDLSPTEERLVADEGFRAEFFSTVRDEIVSEVRSSVERTEVGDDRGDRTDVDVERYDDTFEY